MEPQQETKLKEKQASRTPKASNSRIPSLPSSPSPSPSPSPSREFSFTVSLDSTTTTTTTPSSPTLSAIDLTPADDIFFHGHLLPLHFLSHLHATSPRSSTTSLDSFTLPATQTKPILKPPIHSFPQQRPKSNKSRSFSISGLAKWIKGSEAKEKSKKPKFDVTQFVKRYINMVKPLLSQKGGTSDKFRVGVNQSYSFSGSLTTKMNKRELNKGLRGELSAPTSTRTSPTNSGRLLPNVGVQSSPISDSTMEELQSAIQAAIAHCKNSSTSVPDKLSQDLASPVSVN